MKISGQIVDIHNRKIYGGVITIAGQRIEKIEKCETDNTLFILPGLIDAHVHVESSMVTPSRFAATAVKHGTVAVVSDPHEIANVLGEDGVRFMIDDAAESPVRFLFGAPSCVPATAFESSGAEINSEQIKKLLDDPSIGYLAEMMNFPGVIFSDPEVMAKIDAAHKAGKVIDGHAPGLSGAQLQKYAAAGISTDHECSTMEEAIEKIGLGMHILIREGSAARNLEALKNLITTYPEKVMLCSDDLHPEMLAAGHINRLVARLISQGFDVFNVLRAVSLNPSIHYGLDTGLLREGDKADFIVTDDLRRMNIIQTWIKGQCVFGEKNMLAPGKHGKTPNRFNASPVTIEDIIVPVKGSAFRVIKAFNGELLTDSFIHPAGGRGHIDSDTGNDILKIVVKDRYNDYAPAIGFISGFGLKNGAFATSVAHDSHNVIGIGTDDILLTKAINMVIAAKGGMAAVDGDRAQILELPVAGLMSDMTVEETGAGYEKLSEMVKDMGCSLDAPFMTLSFMALLVIPKLKIGDRGLFDVTTFSPVSLFAE